MSRVSRIQHQPGSRFIALHAWAVREFGVAGAAVIGLLDFLDRAHEKANQPTASRQRVVAELEFIVGRDQVDRALRTLVEVGAINVHKKTTAGAKNLVTRVEYSINSGTLNKIITGTPEIRSPGDSCPQEPPGQLDPVLNPGVAYTKKEKEEEAAARAQARGAAAAKNNKKRRSTASGIVTWTPDDERAAAELEQQGRPDELAAAVATVTATGRDPVPGLVARAIERQQRARHDAARRAALDAERAALIAAPPAGLDLSKIDFLKLPPALREQALRAASKTNRR